MTIQAVKSTSVERLGFSLVGMVLILTKRAGIRMLHLLACVHCLPALPGGKIMRSFQKERYTVTLKLKVQSRIPSQNWGAVGGRETSQAREPANRSRQMFVINPH